MGITFLFVIKDVEHPSTCRNRVIERRECEVRHHRPSEGLTEELELSMVDGVRAVKW